MYCVNNLTHKRYLSTGRTEKISLLLVFTVVPRRPTLTISSLPVNPYVRSIYSYFFYSLISNLVIYHREYIHIYRLIGPVGRAFTNGPGDLGSIPGRVIPKTLKMVLDTTLFNTQHYKVRIESKMEQSSERSSALPYTTV